jgi:Cu(I)/Ag(I) efflux system protein CusF
MKNTLLFVTIALLLAACGGTATNNTTASAPTAQAPATQAEPEIPANGIPKDGTYVGKGKITKINAAGGSVEIDHEKIPGMMPPMKMEFNVKSKDLLNGLKVGDEIKFEVEYKHPAETITAIKKKTS